MGSTETHLLAYLTWDRVVPWKVLALKDPRKKLFPFAYGSRQHILCRRAMKGTVLWVVTVPRLVVGGNKNGSSMRNRGAHTLPPMLVARLQVESFICERNRSFERTAHEESLGPGITALLKQWGAVVRAGEKGSLFYGPNDATSFLDSLILYSKRNAQTLRADEMPTERERYMSYAYKLQRIRHIDVVKSHADLGRLNPLGPQSEKTVFLSYVRNKNAKFAARLAIELQAQGWSPWLDCLSMPGYRTSRRMQKDISEQEHTSRIACLIKEGLLHCPIFLSLRDEDYDLRLKHGEGGGGKGPCGKSWIRFERDLASARKRRIGHIEVGRVDGRPPVSLGERWPSSSENPRSTAAKLSNLWNADSS